MQPIPYEVLQIISCVALGLASANTVLLLLHLRKWSAD